MANYIPKAEQFDTLNSKLDAINENLKTRASFVEAVAKMENATEAAEKAATTANTAAAGVVSPTATVTKTGDTATITVTDKSGTTTAEVKDGSDATVTKDAVVSALGYEPEAVQGEYELVDTIALTEDVTAVAITDSLIGKAHVIIMIESPSTASYTTINCDAYDDNDTKYYWYLTGMLNKNSAISTLRYDIDNGEILTQFYTAQSSNQVASGSDCRFMWRKNGASYIKSLKFYSNLPSGVVFKVYARA